jgi:hypothetical protein
MSSLPVVELQVSVDEKPPQVFLGREAWALNELIAAGAAGCTPITQPAHSLEPLRL